MKTPVFIILIVLMFLPVNTFAEFLVCDIPVETITACQVDVDGTIISGVMDPGPGGLVIRTQADENGIDHMVLLDEAAMFLYSAGRHNFKARFRDPSGWWSDWSLPLNAGKPGVPGNVHIK